MRVGIVMLPTDPWPETVARARRVEALGYDHVWTYDHLSWRHYRERPWFAAIPWLTGVAASTSRIRLGPLVASPNFRHPFLLAKEAMTLDHVSAGRLILGVGAGGPGFDATVFGGEQPTAGELAARFDEFVTVLDVALREPRISHDGSHYIVNEGRMLPGCVQQPRVPLALAASGSRTLATAARCADMWITHAGAVGTPASADALDRALGEQVGQLEQACVAIGRDPSDIERCYMQGFETERALASVTAFEDFAGRRAAQGFTDLVLHHPRADDPARDDPPEIIEQIANRFPR